MRRYITTKAELNAEIHTLLTTIPEAHTFTRNILTELLHASLSEIIEFFIENSRLNKEFDSIKKVLSNKILLNTCMSSSASARRADDLTVLEYIIEANFDTDVFLWYGIRFYIQNNAQTAIDFKIEFQQVLDAFIHRLKQSVFMRTRKNANRLYSSDIMVLLKAGLTLSYKFLREVVEMENDDPQHENTVNAIFEQAIQYDCVASYDLANNKNALLFAIKKKAWSACKFIVKHNSCKIVLTLDEVSNYNNAINALFCAQQFELATHVITLFPDKAVDQAITGKVYGKLLLKYALSGQWTTCEALLKREDISLETQGEWDDFLSFLLKEKQYEGVLTTVNHRNFILQTKQPIDKEINALSFGRAGATQTLIEYIDEYESDKPDLINWAACGAAENGHDELLAYLSDEGAASSYIAMGVAKAYQKKQTLRANSVGLFSADKKVSPDSVPEEQAVTMAMPG